MRGGRSPPLKKIKKSIAETKKTPPHQKVAVIINYSLLTSARRDRAPVGSALGVPRAEGIRVTASVTHDKSYSRAQLQTRVKNVRNEGKREDEPPGPLRG